MKREGLKNILLKYLTIIVYHLQSNVMKFNLYHFETLVLHCIYIQLAFFLAVLIALFRTGFKRSQNGRQNKSVEK